MTGVDATEAVQAPPDLVELEISEDERQVRASLAKQKDSIEKYLTGQKPNIKLAAKEIINFWNNDNALNELLLSALSSADGMAIAMTSGTGHNQMMRATREQH